MKKEKTFGDFLDDFIRKNKFYDNKEHTTKKIEKEIDEEIEEDDNEENFYKYFIYPNLVDKKIES